MGTDDVPAPAPGFFADGSKLPPFNLPPSVLRPQVSNNPSLPMYSDEVGEVDASHARRIVIDVDVYVNHYPYKALIDFASKCHQKRALRLFTHPGTGLIPGGISSFEGEKINECEDFVLCARSAVTQYNNLCKANLMLEALLKVNCLGRLFYVTFTTYDNDTGNIGTYKAALIRLRPRDKLPTVAVDGFVLGLFIDCNTDKVLACIYITGAEEDLAAKREKKEFCEEAKEKIHEGAKGDLATKKEKKKFREEARRGRKRRK